MSNTDIRKPKIFLFCEPTGRGLGIVNGSTVGGDVRGFALAEDGIVLGNHISSSVEFSKHDMGFSSTKKHEIYLEHFPQGFELEWVDDPEAHEGFKAAFELNQKMKLFTEGDNT